MTHVVCSGLSQTDMDSLEKILVLDFGSQYTHLIVRRIREFNVYSEVRCFDITLSELLRFNPKGIILSGGPSSVYNEEAPVVDNKVWEHIIKNNIPVLGVCYGMQFIVKRLGGVVSYTDDKREYGATTLQIIDPTDHLIADTGSDFITWMSHGDCVVSIPEGFGIVCSSDNCPYAIISNPKLKLWAVQFHPEVSHTRNGIQILKNFVFKIAMANSTWDMKNFFSLKLKSLVHLLDEDCHVIGALSGGIDSTVAAGLVTKAIGKNFHGVLIDNGLLREKEAEECVSRLKRIFPSMNLICVDASKRFLDLLKGVASPEEKRKIIGNQFIVEFQQQIQIIGIPLQRCYLLQGTLYPDVIESTQSRTTHVIKSHHNVGGLPENLMLNVIEPLKELFKDEVRVLGRELGIDAETLHRHPFPGPGLSIRIIGEVTGYRIDVARKADAIFIEELKKSQEYNNISQAFVVLLPDARSVGIMGDCRTYEMTAVLRAVSTSDFMTADWCRLDHSLIAKVSNRIINEVPGINRVCYDVSSKPPATIEWE